MDINEPLHAQIHLWMIGAVIILGYLAVVGNMYWKSRHEKDKRATGIVLGAILVCYFCVYAYLTFFYRSPMEETHIRLDPFWSYKEAFEGINVQRLGVARSIILNIAITIPLGYLLPVIFKESKHRFVLTIVTVLFSSLVTEIIQLISRTGLCELDDVINNSIGGILGLVGYLLAEKLISGIGKKSTR